MLARDLLQAPTLGSILEVLGPALQDLLVADEVLLLLRAGDHEQLTEFDRRGRMRPGRQETDLYRHAIRALDERNPILLPDVAGAVGPKGSLCPLRSASLVALPFPPSEPVGVLAALWHGSKDTDRLVEQISTLRYLGELTAAALGNAAFRREMEAGAILCAAQFERGAREHAEELQRRSVTEDELQRIAITDVMTGMLNRRGFFLQAERSLKVARRRAESSALIFADIDGLKSVNDTLGHDVGDNLIRDAASLLAESFRDSDIIARFGGDEFAAFTLDSAKPEAILARVQDNIEAFHRRFSRPYRLSFSTGIVACDPSSNLTLSDYLFQADQKMYEQKRLKRER